ncbi:TetR/AcrR family transcriptional regulator [Amycolatopsis benzoatilytica]|uniref:TetR/AcrR family transcriptional regulator n=1 Tax=Amycolatopsis benzoatilytica TaxID=346045 RepID=UPI0003753D8E|nr:TetR/AcrR family transcriptional regulator [Amycolatopsis benzoatilytica]
MDRRNEPTSPAGEPGSDWRVFEPLELTPILAAALEVFQENGFHGATVRDISRRVGLTVPSLYYHHESKEGIFAALLDLGTGEAAWRVRAAADAAPGRVDLQFVNVIQAIVLHMAHRRQLATLDNELRHLSPENRQHYAERRKEVENVLSGIVETGAREGIFTPKEPAETARALLGMCQAIVRWYRPDGPLTPDELAERYVDIALMTVGLSRRPGPRPPRRRKARVA